MKRYFEGIKTVEDLKQKYKELVKKLHPDLSKKDTTKEFVEMKKQYEEKFEKVKNTFINSQGEYYEKENTETPEEFTEIIEKLIKIDGINIEIIGSWIWITGNTKEQKDYLKELGFRFSGNKQAWYYHTGSYRKRSKKKHTLSEIREMFDNTKIKEQRKLATTI